MSLGGYISAFGHAGLIGWLLFGGGFDQEPLDFEVTEVSVISTAEFDALFATPAPAITPEIPVALPEPQLDILDPVAPAPEVPPVTPSVEPPPPIVPDPVPDVSNITPLPPTEVEDVPPVVPSPPQVILPDPAPETDLSAIRPRPRPAPRVAPTPVAPPPPDTAVDDTLQQAAIPDENGETVVPEAEATAPEEAATETVSEAEQAAAAPTQSLRPRARPTQTAAAPAAQTPEEAPIDPVAAALAAALASAAPATEDAASGPPLSQGERDALRVAVSRCWNVGSLSTEALGTTVVVGVDMTQDGRPVGGSVRLVSSSGGSAASAQQAYEAARRAIIRCGVSGFVLPPEKYDQWKEIEMTFNPEQMRTR